MIGFEACAPAAIRSESFNVRLLSKSMDHAQKRHGRLIQLYHMSHVMQKHA